MFRMIKTCCFRNWPHSVRWPGKLHFHWVASA